MSPLIQDYEQVGERLAEETRAARWDALRLGVLVLLWVAGFLCHIALRQLLPWSVEALELAISFCFWAAVFIGVLWWIASVKRRRQPRCGKCEHRFTAEEMNRASVTRACPRCQYVFPSRAPPEAQAVALDAEHLPRVWLAHELEVPPETTNSDAPLDESNPYAPSRDVTYSQAPRPKSAFAHLLTLLWFVTVWPAIAIFKTRDQWIADLPPPGKAVDENWLAYAASYARSQRRMAWALLPFTVVMPIALFIAYKLPEGIELIRSDQPRAGLFSLVWGLILSYVYGLAALVGAGVVCRILFRRRFTRWLNGDPAPIKAQHDEKTGYYGLRLRFSDVTRQEQLPTVKFRFRQKMPGELVLRVVNFATAQALEKKVTYAAANAWQTMELDVRWLVRQSDPTFFGDELHFISDPAAGLEVDDLQIVRT